MRLRRVALAEIKAGVRQKYAELSGDSKEVRKDGGTSGSTVPRGWRTNLADSSVDMASSSPNVFIVVDPAPSWGASDDGTSWRGGLPSEAAGTTCAGGTFTGVVDVESSSRMVKSSAAVRPGNIASSTRQ